MCLLEVWGPSLDIELPTHSPLRYAKPVLSIAFDAEYAGKRIFATGGVAGQLVINSKGWFGCKDHVVHSGEGPVRELACIGPMLAWQNDLGVKVVHGTLML